MEIEELKGKIKEMNNELQAKIEEQKGCYQPKPEPEQEPELSRKRKGKRLMSPVKKTPWNEVEEERLAECWINVSKDQNTGNSQTGDSFWGKVHEQYNSKMQVQRTKDQITSKWRNLQLVVRKFNDIYFNCFCDPQGDESDQGIIDEARKIYISETGKQFNSHLAWKVLRNHPKWATPISVAPPERKQKKLPLPTLEVFVEDEDEDEDDEPIHLDDDCQNELIVEDLITGSPSKPRKPKSQRSSSTSDAYSRSPSADIVERLDKISRFKEELFESKKATFKAIQDERRTRTMLEELKFLSTTTDGISEEDRKIIEAAKKTIRQKYKDN